MNLLRYHFYDRVTLSKCFMARGGRREGAGAKPAWGNGKTKPIRVPVAIAERVLEIAKEIDQGSFPQSTPVVSSPKVIDLSGIAILRSNGEPVIRLVDLIRAGYEIHPERLGKLVRASGEKDLKAKNDLESLIQEFI
jgi:hypothetical protein